VEAGVVSKAFSSIAVFLSTRRATGVGDDSTVVTADVSGLVALSALSS
jgi:hypothetical protein